MRAVEDAICLLQGRLDLFDLPVRLFADPPGLLDDLTPARNGLRRLVQLGGVWQPLVDHLSPIQLRLGHGRLP